MSRGFGCGTLRHILSFTPVQRSIDFTSAEPPLIEPEALASWIIHEDDDYFVVDKPGWVVCHPSKNGPWSSLVGALREHSAIDVLHLVSRLDRETSGVVVVAKHPAASRLLQKALQQRRVSKVYLAILEGELRYAHAVNQPIRGDGASQVRVKQTVGFSRTAQNSSTLFEPLFSSAGYSVVKVTPLTGRKHQIRVHAQWIGYPVVGDKLYGPDENLYLEFVGQGWTANLEGALPLRRQALHAWKVQFHLDGRTLGWTAPVPRDLADFVAEKCAVEGWTGQLCSASG